jgi:NitT/TauT family transport system ATP-binding protein
VQVSHNVVLNDAVPPTDPREAARQRLNENIAPLLELDRVSRIYRARDGISVHAINSLSCKISKGEFVSVLGPSGCGKSTLLMMIAGLLEPSAGQVILRGRELRGPESDTGIVFQDPVLFPWRTVQANVELPAEVNGTERIRRAQRARELIELVGLAGFEGKYPYELSGGMQQRVSIARALMLNPSLLLMDEPFGALDAMTREQLNLEIQRISSSSGTTVIFVTHSIPEAAFLSDRVFVMTGRPASIREDVVIDLARPRDLDLMASDRFGVYVRRLRNLLDGRGAQT